MTALGLIGAGIVGFIVGLWSASVMHNKVERKPFTCCKICFARHDSDNHEAYQNWDGSNA